MKQYFSLLEDTLKQNNLLNNPARMYSVDETGMPLDVKSPNILKEKGVTGFLIKHLRKQAGLLL